MALTDLRGQRLAELTVGDAFSGTVRALLDEQSGPKFIARHVAGFDLPPMIEGCRTLATESIDLLVDDWNEVKPRRFDVIVAPLVLQHIEPVTCRFYLADFARMAPATYVLTRVEDDFGTNVLDLIAETGLSDVGECVKVDHDPQTHQLQILGRSRFEEARRCAEAGHYELLLRPTTVTSGA